MGLEEQIIKIVEKYFELADRNDCFVVELVMKTKKLEIYIDSDDAIDFGICRKVSRVVEEFLDEPPSAESLEVPAHMVDF